MTGYSETWLSTFLRTVPAGQTEAETAFLCRQLPRDRFPRVLDVCCGLGRHAVRLAEAGYRVTGVDRDRALIRDAMRISADDPKYVTLDMRRLGELGESFDAAIVLWASFGTFAPQENDDVLRGIRGLLPVRGRLLLDLYHREFFENHQGVRRRERAGRHFSEYKSVSGSRLRVQLQYDDGGEDRFEWELLTPSELADRVVPLGFRLLEAWTDFDEARIASPHSPRYQAVLEAT